MFVSRRRPVVFSQYEHARLAGTLALHWGNSRFPRPPLPFESFVAGVTLHDFGYGLLDEHPIGAMEAPERHATLERLVDARLADPIAETVALFHARRLIGDTDPTLASRCETRIDAALARGGVSRSAHEIADRITDLCDTVAFHFCFEAPYASEAKVPCAQGSEAICRVAWTLDETNRVTLDPWPLSVPRLDVRVVAFEAARYPGMLVPLTVPCALRPASVRPSSPEA